MLYTPDRIQLVDDELIFFEFHHRDSSEYLTRIERKKINDFRCLLGEGIKKVIAIVYDNDYKSGSEIVKKEFSIELPSGREEHFKWDYFKEWFQQINLGESKLTMPQKTKELGISTENEGDPFVQELLRRIYGVETRNDDNGIAITKDALSGVGTTGFDFDLYESSSRSIIEFLKRDSKYIANIKAHPMRYMNNGKNNNYQKFISLWKAKEILNGNLFLINYSDSLDEPISVIEVLRFEINGKDSRFIEDIGYCLNYEQLFEWLRLLESNYSKGMEFLKNFPKEYRNKSFWGKFPGNKSVLGTRYIE